MTDIDIQGELRVHLSSLERKRDQQRASLKSLLWHLADNASIATEKIDNEDSLFAGTFATRASEIDRRTEALRQTEEQITTINQIIAQA